MSETDPPEQSNSPRPRVPFRVGNIYRAVKRDDYFGKRAFAYWVGSLIATAIYALSVQTSLEWGITVPRHLGPNSGVIIAINRMFDEGFIIFFAGIIPVFIHTKLYGRIRTWKDIAWLTLAATVTAYMISHLVFTLTLDDPANVPIFRDAMAFGWFFGAIVFGWLRRSLFDHWHYD